MNVAFIKSKTTEFGMEYNYWIIDKFNIFYTNGKGVVDVIFSAYISKDVRDENVKPYTQINQQIPFEVLLAGLSKMIGYTDKDIKDALYSLKPYYEYFVDAEDDVV